MLDQEIQDYYQEHPSARWFALLSISLASFTNSISHSSVNVATPMIASDLQANAILVSWVPTAFLLSNVIVLLPAGRLADIYGRKKIYVIGMLIFIFTSMLAYLTNSIETLLVIRGLQGIGAAMMFATTMAMIMSLFTEKNRGVALGIASGSLYIGLASGPLLGGWFTEVYGWRSVFIFPAVISTTSLLLVFFFLKGEWKSKSPLTVDWIGALIFTVWASFLFIGVSIFPGINSYILLFVGFTSLFVFYLQQNRSKNPLVRFKAILDNHIFSRSLFASCCTYASNFPLIFLFSLYLQFIKNLSPTETGKIIILQAVMMAILAPIAGKLSDLFEPRIIATLGCLIMSSAFGALMAIDADTSLYFFSGCLICLGIGFGMFTTPNNNAALSSVEKDKLSIASALLNLSRTMGNMVGTAMMLLLVAVIIGDAKIEPSQYNSLLQVIRLALGLSCLYTICGAYFSYTRGNIRTSSA